MMEFDLSLYSKQAVLQAISDYKEIAVINWRIITDVFQCEFSQTKYDLETTMNEFGNYVLELSAAGRGEQP